ncbi:MAG: hypothetical protein CL746_06425 [Chloroflexi bacterium]|nr:hypothetical protein [Chloroflexota bacterium]
MQKYKFFVSGMTCDSCTRSIKNVIKNAYPQSTVDLSLNSTELLISTNSEIQLGKLNEIVSQLGDYKITDKKSDVATFVKFELETNDKPAFKKIKNYFDDKKPLLIALFVVIITSTCLSINSDSDELFNKFLSYYMGMFFVIFSFLKLLSVKGFASSFSGYDMISKKIYKYSLIYPFIELVLGLYYLSGNTNLFVSIFVIFIMISQTYGVVNVVLNKKSIRCACMGESINLNISEVTLLENIVMILISSYMIYNFIF